MDKKKVKCPFCGHEQKIQYTPDAKCRVFSSGAKGAIVKRI
ncbi:MAG: hypothetical protein ACLVFM_11555 [Blautia faecis]